MIVANRLMIEDYGIDLIQTKVTTAACLSVLTRDRYQGLPKDKLQMLYRLGVESEHQNSKQTKG